MATADGTFLEPSRSRKVPSAVGISLNSLSIVKFGASFHPFCTAHVAVQVEDAGHDGFARGIDRPCAIGDSTTETLPASQALDPLTVNNDHGVFNSRLRDSINDGGAFDDGYCGFGCFSRLAGG